MNILRGRITICRKTRTLHHQYKYHIQEYRRLIKNRQRSTKNSQNIDPKNTLTTHKMDTQVQNVNHQR